MNGPGWYARRLRTMSAPEMLWRAASTGRTTARRWRSEPSDGQLLGTAEPDWAAALDAFRLGRDRPVLLDRDRGKAVADAHPDAATRLVAAATRIVDGRVRYFGYPEVELGRPVDWHHDPVAGVRWPDVESARLDHRSAAGDAKWIWELNRLQHLPWLAQAWLLTGEDRFADTAWEHLDSWLAQNPPGRGIAWRGAFEAGVRAVSVAVAVQGLRDSAGLTEARYRAVVRMLAESARRCWDDRSRFSSANNHLVGELTGLAVVSLLLPELAGSARGLRRALAALSTEADRQILPDGAGAEQAVAYHLFTAELLLLVAALARLDGRVVPAPVLRALDRGAEHLAALVGEDDPVPRFGDDDEGFAVRLDAAPLPDVRSHLAAVAAVTGSAAAARFGRAGPAAAWLGGPEPAPVGPAPGAAPGDLYAPDGGLVVLRSGDRRVLVDVGPLGYLTIAAHGHADALAVTVAAAGRDLVGDPGAGSYYGHPAWRRVHRGTRAHATVGVDGLDQSVMGGPFLWTRRATVRVRGTDLPAGVVDAEHDGYARLAEPVLHRRWVSAPPGDPTVLVVDLVTGPGDHEVRTSWPLHPDLVVDPAGPAGSGFPAHRVTRDGVAVLGIAHAATAPLRREEVRGDEVSGLGWWSTRLESRTPAWLVGVSARGPLPVVVATALTVGAVPVVTTLSVTAAADRIAVEWTGNAEAHGLLIDPTRPATVARR